MDVGRQQLQQIPEGLFRVFESLRVERLPESQALMGDVRLLLTELRRFVLLWDELWVTVLQQMHPQVEQLI